MIFVGLLGHFSLKRSWIKAPFFANILKWLQIHHRQSSQHRTFVQRPGKRAYEDTQESWHPTDELFIWLKLRWPGAGVNDRKKFYHFSKNSGFFSDVFG